MRKHKQVFNKHRPEITKVSKDLKRRLEGVHGKAKSRLRIYFLLDQIYTYRMRY